MWVFLPGLRWSSLEANCNIPSSTDDKNVRSKTTISPHDFMTRTGIALPYFTFYQLPCADYTKLQLRVRSMESENRMSCRMSSVRAHTARRNRSSPRNWAGRWSDRKSSAIPLKANHRLKKGLSAKQRMAANTMSLDIRLT